MALCLRQSALGLLVAVEAKSGFFIKGSEREDGEGAGGGGAEEEEDGAVLGLEVDDDDEKSDMGTST